MDSIEYLLKLTSLKKTESLSTYVALRFCEAFTDLLSMSKVLARNRTSTAVVFMEL